MAMMPEDWGTARLLGRCDFGDGPTSILIEGGHVFDLSRVAPTVRDNVERCTGQGSDLGLLETLDLSASAEAGGQLLAPIDLHCIKAAGVDYHVPFGGTCGASHGAREQGFAAVEYDMQAKTVYVGD